MAANENQGLQIAVILFVMLTIVLSVTTFMFFRQYDEAEVRASRDAERAKKSEQDLRKTLDELDRLREIIGIGKEARLDEIETAYTADMEKYGATVPAEQRFYRQSAEFLFTSVNEVKGQLAAAQAEIDQLKKVNAAFEAAKNTEIVQFETAAKKATDELAAERAKFADELQKKNQELDGVRNQLEQKNQEMTALAAKGQQQEAEKVKEIKQHQETIAVQSGKIKQIIGEGPQSYDGEILRVGERSGTVWINRGRADHLLPRTTFMVQIADLPAGGKHPGKGTIEVTKILDDHLAEARILDDKITDPILPGDQVYTPLWDPGRQLRFAIAGQVDLNADGQADNETLRGLITGGGGTVDAEVDAKGALQGAVSVDTRYLIVGTKPPVATSYQKLIDDADRLGVQLVSGEAFLDLIGSKTDPRQLVRFGQDSNAATYPDKVPDGGLKVSDGSITDLFKKRRPPSTPGGSSYKPTGGTN